MHLVGQRRRRREYTGRQARARHVHVHVVTASTAYGCIWLHVAAASTAHGYSVYRLWRQPSSHIPTAAGKLKRFKVARKPPKHRWSSISAPGKPLVELMVTEHENDKGEKAEKTV